MNLLTCLFIILFITIVYFYAKNTELKYYEGFKPQIRCPDILIQKDAKFYLYNSKVAKVPGVNPVEFNNLEDYVEFLDWQRSQGIRCPVLFLQQTFDAQGNRVYKVRPGVTEQKGGLPPIFPSAPNPTLLVDATRNDYPYNKNSYPAYDESSFYVGTTTPLDTEQNENMLYSGPSANPMDKNWGGAEYTQSLIDKGYFSDNEVSIQVA